MVHPRILVAVAAAWLMVLGGCASSYQSLVSEDQVPDLAPLKLATAAHPNHTTLVTTHGEHGPDVRIAVHEIEGTGSDRLLVLIHGVFADSTTWRFVVGNLAADHDVWLIDLPGCGLSDKPDPG